MRTLDLETLHLYSGAHSPNGKMCVMEAVAYVAGEPWSDSPQCACPVLSNFLRIWNDSLDDANRQRLKPYIPRLVGTRDGNDLRRSWMCFDWLTRECGPAFMDLTPALVKHAGRLRVLPEIVDRATLDAAMGEINAALRAAAAAWAAALSTARDAAWVAAGAAAWAAWADAGAAAGAGADAWAAWAAAGAAAGAAAWAAGAAAGAAAVDAAMDAAWAAAWGAAARLAPLVAHLQESAFALLDRMLSLPKGPAYGQ